jgi:hypothetical protein
MSITSKPYTIKIYPVAGTELTLLEKLHGSQTATIVGYRSLLKNLAVTLEAIASGEYLAALQIVPCDAAAVKASGTLTFSGQPTAGETFQIGNVTFTARASGATGNEFNIGANAAATIVAAAAAVNASATALIAREITATATSATVLTLSASNPGTLGNFIPLSESMTNVVAGGLVNGCLSGGLDTTQDITANTLIA